MLIEFLFFASGVGLVGVVDVAEPTESCIE
jgi:hypothetical protein